MIKEGAPTDQTKTEAEAGHLQVQTMELSIVGHGVGQAGVRNILGLEYRLSRRVLGLEYGLSRRE